MRGSGRPAAARMDFPRAATATIGLGANTRIVPKLLIMREERIICRLELDQLPGTGIRMRIACHRSCKVSDTRCTLIAAGNFQLPRKSKTGLAPANLDCPREAPREPV